MVTPGRRYETRNVTGQLAGTGVRIHSGQSGISGTVCLVHNNYFEPALGHTPQQAIAALEARTRLGRPALLETHRFNFPGSAIGQKNARAELKKLLQRALVRYPDEAFMSIETLARVLSARDPDRAESRLARRIHVRLVRLGESSRLRKLVWLSGWIVPGGPVRKLTG
jgi:hypothetical protein